MFFTASAVPVLYTLKDSFRQTGNIFRKKSGGFRRTFKHSCEFGRLPPSSVHSPANTVFIDAPLEIPDAGDNAQGLGWWLVHEDNTFNVHEKIDFLSGFNNSVSTVKEALRTQGPFDGIFAFSQGAAFVTLLQILMEKFPEQWDAPKVKFCILIAPFKSRCSLHTPLYAFPIQMPTLIVYGMDDKVIPADMTKELLDVYEPPHTTLVHPGGHRIPTNAEAKAAFRSFLDRFRLET